MRVVVAWNILSLPAFDIPSVSAKTSRTEVATTRPHPSTTCFVWTKIQCFLMNIDHKPGPISWRGIFFSCLIIIILFKTRFASIVLLDENKTDWIKYFCIVSLEISFYFYFAKWDSYTLSQCNEMSLFRNFLREHHFKEYSLIFEICRS